MAQKLKKHQERQHALSLLGKPMARRARSKCELCTAAGVSLAPLEVPPIPEEPELESTLMLCEPCHKAASGKKIDFSTWRFLESAVWSELPATQVVAVRLLKKLGQNKVAWANDTLENLYLDPDIESWVEGGE